MKTYKISIFRNDSSILNTEIDADVVIELMRGFIPLPEEEMEPLPKIKPQPKYVSKVTKDKKARFCGKCHKEGHRADGCTNGKTPKSLKEPKIKINTTDDEELSEQIQELWVDQDMSSPYVCEKLGISLGVLNRIVMKYGLKKKRSNDFGLTGSGE